VEPSPLDTAGAIRFAAAHAGFLDGDSDEPIIAVNGDVLTTLDLTAQLAFHTERGARATIALTQVEDPSAFGVVPCHADGRVIAFVEKPPRDEAPTDWINGGTYVLHPSVIRRVAPDTRVSIERVIFPELVAEGSLYAIHASNPWIDAGIPSTYLQANLDAIADSSDPRGLVDPSAFIDESAVVVNSVIGAGCVVARGATVRNIGVDASVIDSMVGESAQVLGGANLRALSVIGDGAVVAAGSDFTAERFPS
jgi:mannose-1-phosphate guanylyltransferase